GERALELALKAAAVELVGERIGVGARRERHHLHARRRKLALEPLHFGGETHRVRATRRDRTGRSISPRLTRAPRRLRHGRPRRIGLRSPPLFLGHGAPCESCFRIAQANPLALAGTDAVALPLPNRSPKGSPMQRGFWFCVSLTLASFGLGFNGPMPTS